MGLSSDGSTPGWILACQSHAAAPNRLQSQPAPRHPHGSCWGSTWGMTRRGRSGASSCMFSWPSSRRRRSGLNTVGGKEVGQARREGSLIWKCWSSSWRFKRWGWSGLVTSAGRVWFDLLLFTCNLHVRLCVNACRRLSVCDACHMKNPSLLNKSTDIRKSSGPGDQFSLTRAVGPLRG